MSIALQWLLIWGLVFFSIPLIHKDLKKRRVKRWQVACVDTAYVCAVGLVMSYLV